MCGLAGWFTPGANDDDAAPRLRAMLDAIAHRGPDDDGVWLNRHAALGHKRLSIIDVDGGHQPMRSGDLTIVYNGEIYNFRELRRELEGMGWRFRTHSDTEVIPALYHTLGWPGFGRLRGMYAFALWDQHRRRGWMVRDPLGIKPLFIHLDGKGRLYFGSEAKAILASGAVAPALAEDGLHLLMNFRYLPGRRSLFAGVEQVAPGEVLEWQPDGRLRRHRLEAPLASSTPPSKNRLDSGAALGADVLECMRDSVRCHLVSDVRVGAYLSGGMDSATIATMSVEASGEPMPTFTLNVGDDPREAANALESATLLGLPNRRGASTTPSCDDLRRLVWHLEVPKVNALQVNALAATAAREVKVALSGLGGDELFLGYNAHRIMHLANRAHRWLPGALRRWTAHGFADLWRLVPGAVWRESDRALAMLAGLGDWPMVYGQLRNLWDNPALRRLLYGPRMLDAELPDAYASLRDRWPERSDPVSAMTEFEWREKMVNDLLWQEDRASMAEGLEVRVPFVDRVLAARVLRLAPRELMPMGRRKGLMRRAVKPLLPARILARPKSGFQLDAPTFLTRELDPLAWELLSDQTVARHGVFNPAFVHHCLRFKPAKHLRWHYFILYLMMMTHLWLEAFESRSAGRPDAMPAGRSSLEPFRAAG